MLSNVLWSLKWDGTRAGGRCTTPCDSFLNRYSGTTSHRPPTLVNDNNNLIVVEGVMINDYTFPARIFSHHDGSRDVNLSQIFLGLAKILGQISREFCVGCPLLDSWDNFWRLSGCFIGTWANIQELVQYGHCQNVCWWGEKWQWTRMGCWLCLMQGCGEAMVTVKSDVATGKKGPYPPVWAAKVLKEDLTHTAVSVYAPYLPHKSVCNFTSHEPFHQDKLCYISELHPELYRSQGYRISMCYGLPLN